MPRPVRARALAVFLAATAAACQDYNFNPIGHCVIQPGSQRFTLSNVATADVLFVIDDSGSMGGEQAALARNFDVFVNNLDRTNVARASGGMAPIDFHLAVTTSSVFWNFETDALCRSDCPGAEGQLVCCAGAGTPVRQPRRCGSSGECAAGTSCRLNCADRQGELYCCAEDGTIPPTAVTDLVPCSRDGVMCGTMETHYDFRSCTSPTSANEWPYPQGSFVSRTSSGVGRFAGFPGPRVVHFDKELYSAGLNRQGFTRGELIELFKENVQVGTCGSGQEQALQGGRLAVQKAFAGEQRDTYDASGARVWTPATPTQFPGTVAARWPHSSSKLVVVFVGDEDDCSSPVDPSGGVVMRSDPPGSDACTRDASTGAPLGGKQFPVSEFVEFFKDINRYRPVAAAFILPAAEGSCTIETCTAGGLCCPAGGCSSVDGAQARGTRLLAAARGLAQAGIEVVAGSICDPDFGKLLNDVAEIVKPPQTLILPSDPAESRIALLRIADVNGSTRLMCGAPLAPSAEYASLAAAQASGADWWFTASADPGPPSGVSRFVYINPNGGCRANPGETYSAEYLGVVPAGGCATDDDCTRTLGGQTGAYTCFVPPGVGRGTCTCATGAR